VPARLEAMPHVKDALVERSTVERCQPKPAYKLRGPALQAHHHVNSTHYGVSSWIHGVQKIRIGLRNNLCRSRIGLLCLSYEVGRFTGCHLLAGNSAYS